MTLPAYRLVLTPRLPLAFAARSLRACLALLFMIPAVSWGDVPPAERDALLDLYASTGGPGWTNSAGWNGPPGTECTWFGVFCDAAGSVVEQVILPLNNLAGTLPPSIGQLTSLTTLVLDNNHLLGSICPEIGDLGSLVVLSLSLNQLSGEIPPALGDLASLEGLFLGGNQLSGSLPPQLANLANLQTLALGGNHLTGSIPPGLGDLAQLVRLNLAKNELTGGIPAELGALGNLRLFLLGENRLSGSIPTELGNLTNLENFVLSSNLLTGGIPATLGNLTRVQDMDLSFNQLSGGIPPELGNLVELRFLQLESNQLSGEIPSTIGNLLNLLLLDLHANRLSGEIPGELQNLTNLSEDDPAGFLGLHLSYNALHTDDPALAAFLDVKHVDGDWRSTQTIAPTDLATGAATATSLTLSWTPIAYTADSGGYVVGYSTTAGGPYTFFTRTASKSVSSVVVTGLAPATTYRFVLSTVTDPHGGNLNTVTSELSAEVAGATETAGNTPAGSAVVVQPVDSTTGAAPATLTFATVAQAGETTLTTSAAGPAPPAGFQLGTPATYYEISTTATFTGTVAVCIDYTGTSFTDEDQLRLLHFESGAWVDATTSLDTAQDVVCGTVTSLSPFLVAQRVKVAVRIDIKPGSDPNRIDLSSSGKVPVAIFSDAGFDARTVDPGTVTLAQAPVEVKPNGRLMASFEDVDGDGRLDLVVHFRISALELAPGDTKAVLKGWTTAGVRIRGVDAVRVVP